MTLTLRYAKRTLDSLHGEGQVHHEGHVVQGRFDRGTPSGEMSIRYKGGANGDSRM